MLNRTVRIAAGCSVDVTLALPQMARYGNADYIIIDYMYEGSVATMAADLTRNPQGGFAVDFASAELEQELQRILGSGAKIITNAGGLNPLGCAAVVRALADRLGLKPRIAVVHGDNIIDQAPALRAAGYCDMFTGSAPTPISAQSRYRSRSTRARTSSSRAAWSILPSLLGRSSMSSGGTWKTMKNWARAR